MAMGRRKTRQEEFWVATADLAKSPGHPFYDRLNKLLVEHDFDRFAEGLCEKFYATTMGRPSIAPGVYFRCLLIGYFEGLDSERGIDWRCADSLSLRKFLGCGPNETTPDHSSISRTRRLIDLETHREVFGWIQRLLAAHGLIKGNRIGIDASTMEANAAMRSIVRNDTHESYAEFLTQLAAASGIETPTREELIKFDRERKNKKVSNDDWHNPYDPDAKIAKLKDGRTHLAYKNEHAVDLDTGAVIAAEIHPADQGDTTTMWGTLDQASAAIQTLSEDETVGEKVATHAKLEAVLDKGYHSNETVVELERTGVRGYIAEPDHGRRDWQDENPKDGVDRREAQSAVYRNRWRMRGAYGKRLHRKRGELVERAFAHVLDTGGMRRAWLKGKENLHKRYLIHVGGFNLSLVMRQLTGHGTPRQWAGAFLRFLERCITIYKCCMRPWKAFALCAARPTCWSRAPRYAA